MNSAAAAVPLPRRRHPAPLLAGAALAALVTLAFWPVVSGRRSFFHTDLYYEHLPIWAATQRALRAGDSPYWLDGEYCGQPLLFHQEAPVLYPLTVPLLLTGAPVHRLADFFTLFHVWIAGLGVYFLVRELTGEPAAGLFGGVAFMLSARMVQSALWPNAVAVTAFLPLILYGLTLIAQGRRRAGIVCAASSGGLALLGARPHVLLAAAPLLAATALALWWTSTHRRRTLADFGLAGILALALGAPSVLPSAILLPATSRAGGLSSRAPDFQPLAHGRDLDMLFLPVDGGSRWPETASYPGAVAGVLALSSVFLLVRRRAWPLRTVTLGLLFGGAVGLMLAFGDRGPYRYVSRLPVVRGFRIPERFLLSWSLSIALAAALALAYWLGRSRRPVVLAAIVLAALAVDLVWHARRAAPTAPAAVYEMEPVIATELQRRLGSDALGFPRRYLSVADTIHPLAYSERDQLSMLRFFEPLKLALGMRYGLEAVNGYGPTLQRTDEFLSAWNPRAAELTGVGAVVSSAPRAGDENPDQARRLRLELGTALPRAILVPGVLVVPAAAAVRTTLSSAIDPRRTAVLEEGDSREPDAAGPDAAGSGWSEGAASVRLLGRRPGRVALTARLPAAGVLILFDIYEAGWQARVDGEPAAVLRADGAFRGLRLPQGEHRIEFFYVGRGVREGLGLAVAGILGLLLATMRMRLRVKSPD